MSVLNMFRVDGKVAFVNGAGRGIGAASAIALAEAGADVAIRARTVGQLDDVAEAIRAHGRRALVVVADDSVQDDDLSALDRAVDEFGRLDILVNVVGGAMPGPFMRARDRDFEQAFQFNVMTAIRLVRAAVPHLLATGDGSVINITTAAAHMVGRGYTLYGTVKAALDHATPPVGGRSVSEDSGQRGGPGGDPHRRVGDGDGQRRDPTVDGTAHPAAADRYPRRDRRRGAVSRVAGGWIPHRQDHRGRRWYPGSGVRVSDSRFVARRGRLLAGDHTGQAGQ